MTTLTFEKYDDADGAALAEWLAADTWPFHGKTRQSREAYEKLIRGGAIAGENERVFWIHGPEQPRAGLLRILDVTDITPEFDIRLRSELRGQGIGRAAVSWITRHIFETLPDAIRVEAHTREDNVAMRKAFLACGYVKEAHYREGWPAEDGVLHACIGYGITRTDWTTGEVTPVPWDDDAR